MSTRRTSILCGIVLSLATGLAAQAQSREESYGATVAQRNCSQCHAIGARGDSPNTKAPRFRELHKRFVIPDLQGRLLEQLMLHHQDMPQFRLSMEELTGLIAYLKSLQTDQLSYAPAAVHVQPKA